MSITMLEKHDALLLVSSAESARARLDAFAPEQADDVAGEGSGGE